MHRCLYDCQGNLTCKEPFVNSPAPSLNCGPRFNKTSCDAGMICIDGSCKRGDERDDLSLQNDTVCDYSGAGINSKSCNFSSIDESVCGVNNGKRCKPQFYCNENGQCVKDKPTVDSQNCSYFSGSGISKCVRKISSNNTCGPNNGYKSCPTGLFCAEDGTCTTDATKVANRPDVCKLYSGSGIVDCNAPGTPSRFVPAPARAAPAPARAAPAPARAAPAPSGPYTLLSDKLVQIPRSGASTTKSISSVNACQTQCTNATSCGSFLYDSTKQECTSLSYNKNNINNYVQNATSKGVYTVGYKN